MKYWLLTTEYPPLFGGGIGTYCYQWCQIMKEKGHRITVFLPDSKEKDYTVVHNNGIRFVYFSPYLNECSSFFGYDTMLSSSFEAIIEIFLRNEGIPDWLEAQEYKGIAYFILQKKHLGYALFKDLKVQVTIHAPSYIYFEFNHISPYQLPYFWIGEMERFCIKAATICIAPSQYIIDRILERHPKLNREFFVLHNPYESHQGILPITTHQVKEIAFIAKLSPSKGILQTLNYFDRMWQQGSSCRLNLIGDESYFYHAKGRMMGDYIKDRYAHYLKNGYLKLAGSLKPEAIRNEIRKASIIIIPSTVDNFPYTALECMWQGKIVLASTQGGQAEIIEDGVNGFLFDHNEPLSFNEKVDVIFSLDEVKIESIGAAAYQTVKKACDTEKYHDNKIAILQKVREGSIKDFPFVYLDSVSFSSEEVIKEDPGEALLSVVIPYYNMGDYVMETIRSIRDSSYKKVEIIIVDDGSNEPSSLRQLKQLEDVENIKIVRQQNKGLAIARNQGAKQAKGKYMAFLDPDDTVDPGYFSKAIEVLREKQNVHFVGCWVQYFGNSRSIWPSFTPEPPYILMHNTVNSSALIYKKDSFLAAGLNDPFFIYGMEDYDSVISMVEKGYGGVVLPERLYNYRVRSNSMARGFNSANMTYLYYAICQKHISLYTIFAAEINSLLNANGPGYKCENPTLDYHIIQNASFRGKMLRKATSKFKQYPFLRKIGLTIYRKLNS